jgi:hypothetical protein
MKKIKLSFALIAALMLGNFGLNAFAKDAKETTISGKMVCAKCVLHETKACQNVVQVQQGGKTVNYYLVQNDISKAKHEDICGGGSENVTATGTVKEKDGKEMMTVSKIDVIK